MTTKTEPSGTIDGVRRYVTAPRRRIAWLVSLAVGLPIVSTLLAVLVIRLGAAERQPGPADPARVALAPPSAAPAPPQTSVAASPAAAAHTPNAIAARRRAIHEAGTAEEKAAHPQVGRAAGPGTAPAPLDDTRPEIDAADAITALRAEGETEGIAAFGLPGTDPPKPGVIVPDGFELPEGFVRHYQTTDDGQQLPPILMVHPDYDLVDAAGKPIAMPDGIVPPELVPPGMPVEILKVPDRRTRTNLPD